VLGVWPKWTGATRTDDDRGQNRLTGQQAVGLLDVVYTRPGARASQAQHTFPYQSISYDYFTFRGPLRNSLDHGQQAKTNEPKVNCTWNLIMILNPLATLRAQRVNLKSSLLEPSFSRAVISS
jgi:hypothetical protein